MVPQRIKVILNRTLPCTLDRSAAFKRSGSTHAERASLGAGDTDATPMLVEESAALLTKLLVGRVLLTEGSEKGQRTLVSEEIEEPDELRVQATVCKYAK